MTVCGKTMGVFAIFSIFTICSQIVYASIQDFNPEPDSNDYYQQRDWYNPGTQRRGFGPPSHRFGPPSHRFGPPSHRFGPPNHRFWPALHSFGPPTHRWHGPDLNNYGHGYNKPTTWNNYPDYDNLFSRRTQGDYWVFPDTHDRFPSRDKFPTPSMTFAPPSSTFTPRPMTPGSTATTISPELQDCIRSCPVTSEYNPVCGSNNMTYTNPSRLQCAQFCGVDVQLRRSFPCATPTTNPATETSVTTFNPFIPSVAPTTTTTEFPFTIDERFQDKQK